MTEKTEATRTCTACGQKKPLVAFLELSGTQGRGYGSICADCRGAGVGQKSGIESEPGDKSSDDTTRFQLDHKARMQTELEKAEQFKHRSDLESQEKSKKETLALEKTTEETLREENEKKQREKNLDAQKQKSTAAKTSSEKPKTASLHDRQKVMQTFAHKKNWADKSHTAAKAEDQQHFNNQEAQKTAAETSKPTANVNTHEYTATVERSAGSVFSRFRDYLGNSAPINRTLAIYGKKSGLLATPKNPAASSKENAQKSVEKIEKKTVTEFVNNNIKRR